MFIIVFLIILSVLVIVHELGHYLVARYFGVRVDEFGLGYPPRLKSLFKYKGTLFTLNALPIGGFVKIAGENPNAEEALTPDSFASKNHAQQIAILAGGVIFNLIFALVLLLISYGLSAGAQNMLVWTRETFLGLGQFFIQLVAGEASLESVSGPVGMVALTREVVNYGWRGVFDFTALISINLAIINLLPIPALDGGRILFALIESATRRKVPPTVFNIINNLSFLALIILMVVVTIHDVSGL